MNYLKSVLLFSGIAAMAFLQSPMTQTSVEARGGSLSQQTQTPAPDPAPVPKCNMIGYGQISCAVTVPNCTGGTFKSALIGGTNGQDFKTTGTTSARGNCTGNDDCQTPQSSDLTSAGC
ncbi:MAG: hypothetical protein AB8B55_10240 [Mariniblastus sp.]